MKTSKREQEDEAKDEAEEEEAAELLSSWAGAVVRFAIAMGIWISMDCRTEITNEIIIMDCWTETINEMLKQRQSILIGGNCKRAEEERYKAAIDGLSDGVKWALSIKA